MPTDLIAWFANNLSAPVLIVGLAWALLKDKPLIVLGRHYREEREQREKAEAKTERYLNLILKINDQANKSTHVAEEALNVAKGKTTTGGRVGSKGQRQADADETN